METGFAVVGSVGICLVGGMDAFYRAPLVCDAERDNQCESRSDCLLRSRFLWQFTLSKVFSDPVWYFYTFWLPQ